MITIWYYHLRKLKGDIQEEITRKTLGNSFLTKEKKKNPLSRHPLFSNQNSPTLLFFLSSFDQPKNHTLNPPLSSSRIPNQVAYLASFTNPSPYPFCQPILLHSYGILQPSWSVKLLSMCHALTWRADTWQPPRVFEWVLVS